MSVEMEIDEPEKVQQNDSSDPAKDLRKIVESICLEPSNQPLNLTKQIPRFRRSIDKQTLETSIKEFNSACIGLLDALHGKKVTSVLKSDNETLDMFYGVLIQVQLLDSKQYEAGLSFASALVTYIKAANSRKLDALSARTFYYYAHFAELLGHAQEIRPVLLQLQRTATLRHDNFSLATLLTLLLRNHLLVNDISGADKLIARTTFPTTAPNAIIARYLYYLARVRAIQLDYSSANDNLTNAIRKIDANEHTAGFLQAAHKLNIIVQLLIGEIPEKADLKGPYLERALVPYSNLVNAVRKGDLNEFGKVVAKHSAQFQKDGTLSLISRLRNNVLKTGIRSISLSYSRISLKDICLKLGLQSEESAEYIISKAIHENIISASLNHEAGELLSSVPVDIYSSDAPQKGFHDRIKFCLELRNESVRAMRFPEDTGRKAISEVEEQMRRMDESLIGGDHDDVEEI